MFFTRPSEGGWGVKEEQFSWILQRLWGPSVAHKMYLLYV